MLLFILFPDGVRGGLSPISPTRGGPLGDEEEEEEEDEFGGQETLVTAARAGRVESEFSQQDTLIIREEQGVSQLLIGVQSGYGGVRYSLVGWVGVGSGILVMRSII